MMKRLALALAALPASASAFFDPFDGSALGAHWFPYSEGSGWVHNVSGGSLNVTGLTGPFDFDEYNIYANVEGYGDFFAETRVMWDAGAHMTFSFGLAEEFPQFPLIGVMRYQVSPTQNPTVSAFLNAGGSGSTAAPGANEWHTFRIVRSGGMLSAYLDGSLLASTSTPVPDPANKVFLHFGGPETEAFGEIRVDYVNVVPEPASLAAVGLGLAALIRFRRPTSK